MTIYKVMNKKQQWQKLFYQKLAPTPVERLEKYLGTTIFVKRDDLNHPLVQGNKLRKLKYNFKQAIDENYTTVATFGGAWSNHILATATAANYCGLNSVGFIRGEELKSNRSKWSTTLQSAEQKGMRLVFLNRQDYRLKYMAPIVQAVLRESYNKVYLVPEGGSNLLAIKGVEEIIEELKQQMDEPTHIISACGTGGTLAGLIDGVAKQGWKTKVLGIPVLKGGEFLQQEIQSLSTQFKRIEWKLYCDYHAGGYAKMDNKTLEFAHNFTKNTRIKLDKIYTAKVFYAAYDLIKKGEIPEDSKVVILHTGGLQGGVI